MSDKSKYLTSKEKRAQLNISACELMHMREDGKLIFIKKGNSYLYKKTE